MESLKSLMQILNRGTIPMIMNQEEYVDFQPTQKFKEGINHKLCRIFVVVMDYDPQSLCITGHPDLELQVQSGITKCAQTQNL